MCSWKNLLKEETHKLTAASNADDEEDPIASDDDETAKNEMYIEDDEVSTQEWTFWWPIINSGPA